MYVTTSEPNTPNAQQPYRYLKKIDKNFNLVKTVSLIESYLSDGTPLIEYPYGMTIDNLNEKIYIRGNNKILAYDFNLNKLSESIPTTMTSSLYGRVNLTNALIDCDENGNLYGIFSRPSITDPREPNQFLYKFNKSGQVLSGGDSCVVSGMNFITNLRVVKSGEVLVSGSNGRPQSGFNAQGSGFMAHFYEGTKFNAAYLKCASNTNVYVGSLSYNNSSGGYSSITGYQLGTGALAMQSEWTSAESASKTTQDFGFAPLAAIGDGAGNYYVAGTTLYSNTYRPWGSEYNGAHREMVKLTIERTPASGQYVNDSDTWKPVSKFGYNDVTCLDAARPLFTYSNGKGSYGGFMANNTGLTPAKWFVQDMAFSPDKKYLYVIDMAPSALPFAFNTYDPDYHKYTGRILQIQLKQ